MNAIARGLLIAVACVLCVTPAGAGLLQPSKPSQLLTLSTYNVTICGTGGQLLDKVENADGSSSTLSIPTGQVLVVTDLEMNIRTTPGTSIRASIQRYQGSTPKSFFIDNQYLTADQNGFARFTMNFSQGRVVKSGLGLCVYAIDTNTSSFLGSNAVVQGFLTKDK